MCLKNCAVIILPLLAALQSAADIYRCQTEDGKWLFTDGQCNNEVGQKVKLSPLVTFKKLQPSANLSEAEHRILIDLDQRMAESRNIRSRQHQQISRQIMKNKKIRRDNCAFAKRHLAKIQDKRSHGYKLSEANALDRQVRNLSRMRTANCR